MTRIVRPKEVPALVFVGGGPGTVGILERIAASAPELLGPSGLDIHVVDPFPAGAGRIWRTTQSTLLWMNSTTADVTIFTDESVTCEGPIVPGPSLAEWVAAPAATSWTRPESAPRRRTPARRTLPAGRSSRTTCAGPTPGWCPRSPGRYGSPNIARTPSMSASMTGGALVTAVFTDVSDGLRLAAGPQAGESVHGEITAEIAEAGSLLWLRYREVLVELIMRGGRYAVRVRDPQGPELAAFHGIPAFPVSEAWQVPATFTAFDAPRAVTVDTARDDLRQNVTAVGTVSFPLDGRRHTLTATRGPDDRLYVSFRDLTNGTKRRRGAW